MTGGKGGTLGAEQLHLAFARLGLPMGHAWLVAALFKDMDADLSGVVSERDFTLWINDVAGSSGSGSRELTLLKPLPRDPALWGPIELRLALQKMLLHAKLGPADLLRAWDTDRGGQLDRKE